jgi:phosphatidylserine/phosphatidylglycerophosphate/cardiolipin synthase-like enzyme
MSKIVIGREYPDVVTDLVKNAQQSIKILIYDWRWYSDEVGSRIQKFNNEIVRASRRGVDVSVLVNSDFIGNPLAEQKIKVRKINSSRVMHVKMLIFDDKYLVLGSHNLTKNAFELNHEISVLLEDVESINKCRQFFNQICPL